MADDRSSPLVLIGDEHLLVREMLREGLAAEGYRTVVAPDGETVLALAARERPALIVLDLLMPDRHGHATLLGLREHPVTRDIPVVTLAGYGAPSFAVLARELGAAAHVTKPVSRRDLIRTVSRLLEPAEVAEVAVA